MPLVRIETRRGLTAQQKTAVLDAVHAALVAAFGIPDHDRRQRIIEYDTDDFEVPAGKDRYLVVTIDALAGRPLDAKRTLYREIAERVEEAGIAREDVVIVLHEIPHENWGTRGGFAAVDLGIGPTRTSATGER